MAAAEKKIDQNASENDGRSADSHNPTGDVMKPMAVNAQQGHADAASPARDLQARLSAEVTMPEALSARHVIATILTVCLATGMAGLVLTASA